MRNLTSLFALMVFCLSPENSYAQYCPSRISAVTGNSLSEEVASLLRVVYERLGCRPEIEFLPGRRAVHHFNASIVDGELFRLKMIEAEYKKPFVHSTELFRMTTALWMHPSPSIAQKNPTAYILGIVWQEEYVSGRLARDPGKYQKYHTHQQVLSAYNRGLIGHLLSEKQSVEILRKRGEIKPVPVLEKTLGSLPVYHYLDEKYAEFIADFSAEIARDNPFNKLN